MTTDVATTEAPAHRPTLGRWRVPVGAALGTFAVSAMLVARDPHVSGSYGVCPVHALTGGYCPGCGSLRACNDLLTGHVDAAFSSNLLLPFALVWLGWWLAARVADAAGWHVRREPSGRAFCIGLLVVLAVFTFLRNLPGSALAP